MSFRKKQETTRPFDGMRRTTCGNCPTGCGLKVYVRDGKVVDLFGDEEHPVNKGSVCPKGLLTLYHLGNPARLTTVRIREESGRPFRNVGWDEALAFVAGRLKRGLAERGRDSVVVHGAETDPFDYLAAGTLFARRLGTALTPARFFPGPFGMGGVVDRMFGLPASRFQGNTPRDWCNSRCILLYGCDLAASDPIALGPVLDARDRGAILLSIDSRNTVTSSKSTFAVRVRPGTESLFLGGVLRQLLRNGHLDDDFVADWTAGFDQLKASLEFCSPEVVSRACGVAEEDLERFVELAGRARPIQVIAGDWFSRRHLDDADLWGLAALVCLSGSLGIPGGGFNLFGVSPFSFTEAPARPSGDLSLSRLLQDRGPELSALFCYGNPCLAGEEARRVLARVPLVVSLSQYPHPILDSAHVSIPASFWLEYDGLLAFNNGRAVQCHRKVLDAPGDCRPALSFWTGLARAMGLSGPEEREGGEDPVAFCDTWLARNPLTGGMRFADLDPEKNMPGGVLWPCPDRSCLELESSRYINGTIRGPNILFQRNRPYPGSERRFPTDTGRVRLPVSPLTGDAWVRDETFPLRLVLGARVDRVPAWGDFVSDIRPAGANAVRINPRLAEALGVRDGEEVVLKAARASLCVPVRLSSDVAPEVVCLPEGAGGLALFEVPDSGNTLPPFVRVTACKAGADEEAARRAIAGLLGLTPRVAVGVER